MVVMRSLYIPVDNAEIWAIAFRGVKVGNAIAKSINWHDDRANSAGVIGNMLNAEVNSLANVAITVAAAYMEGIGGILVGLILALIFSWPIALAILCIAPLMLASSKIASRVKAKQYSLLQTQEE